MDHKKAVAISFGAALHRAIAKHDQLRAIARACGFTAPLMYLPHEDMPYFHFFMDQDAKEEDETDGMERSDMVVLMQEELQMYVEIDEARFIAPVFRESYREQAISLPSPTSLAALKEALASLLLPKLALLILDYLQLHVGNHAIIFTLRGWRILPDKLLESERQEEIQ